MSGKLRWIEPIAFALSAVALLVAFALSAEGALFSSSQLKERAETIRIVFLTYGVVSAFLCFASFWGMCRRGLTLSEQGFGAVWRELRDLKRWVAGSANLRGLGAWIAVAMALGMMLRAYFLSAPMRCDEAYTFLNYANRDLAHLFYYSDNNNHVFHTLLVRVSAAFIGKNPVGIRLPAFLAGVLLIPASLVFARLLFNGRGGVLVSGIVSVFPFLAAYDTNARGYSMVALLSVTLAIIALRFISNPSVSGCFLMAAITSIGFFTVPTFVFAAAGIGLWVVSSMFVRKASVRTVLLVYVGPFAVMTACITAFLYTPVVAVSNGVESILNNPFVSSLPWRVFWRRLPEHCVQTVSILTHGVPPLLRCIVAAAVFAGFYFSAKRHTWEAFLLLPTLFAGAAVPLLLQHAIPFERNWGFAIPFVLVLSDGGLTLSQVAAHPSIERAFRTAFAFGIMCFTIYLMGHGVVTSLGGESFPEARIAAGFLSKQLATDDEIVAGDPVVNSTLRFYLWEMGIPYNFAKGHHPAVTRKQFLVVRPSRGVFNGSQLPGAAKTFAVMNVEVYARGVPPDSARIGYLVFRGKVE